MKNFRIELLSRCLKNRRSPYNKYPILPYQENIENITSPSNVICHKRGTEFEEFIVQLFDRTLFTLLEWRSDKTVNGISPFMNRFPDLEFYFNLNSESLQFAIECKWREYFYKDCIELNDYQLGNYSAFENTTNIPVFIALGVGNKPSCPSEIYIIPLREIQDRKLHSIMLKPYQRPRPYDSFFLDCSNKILK